MARQQSATPIRSKSEMVYDAIKEAIISGQLKPGTRLVMANLAQKLHVSTQPVREALKCLDAEGYVKWTLNVGAVVSSISVEDIKEDIPILRELEGLATREAVRRMTPDVLEELEAMLAAMRQYVNDNKPREYGLLNKKFHRTIHVGSGNKHLVKILDDLWARQDRLRAVFLLSPVRAAESLEEHEAIVRAVKAGDAETAGRLVEEHRMKAAEELLKYLEPEAMASSWL